VDLPGTAHQRGGLRRSISILKHRRGEEDIDLITSLMIAAGFWAFTLAARRLFRDRFDFRPRDDVTQRESRKGRVISLEEERKRRHPV